MEIEDTRHCVLLPCSSKEHWAVPQNCLAEIVTLAVTEDESPPAQIDWRGRTVPVLDLGASDDAPWKEAHGRTGLIAVFLGLEGEGLDYWGLALRGPGLGTANLEGEEMEDLDVQDSGIYAASFRLDEKVYQVPDLFALQQQMTETASELAQGSIQ